MPGLSGSNLAGTSHERGGTLGRRRLPIKWILLFRALFGDGAICLCDTKAKVRPVPNCVGGCANSQKCRLGAARASLKVRAKKGESLAPRPSSPVATCRLFPLVCARIVNE